MLPAGADERYVRAAADACALARDLINTPSNDMGPEELAAAAKKLAATHKATVKLTIGEDLLKQNYATIYAVGNRDMMIIASTTATIMIST